MKNSSLCDIRWNQSVKVLKISNIDIALHKTYYIIKNMDLRIKQIIGAIYRKNIYIMVTWHFKHNQLHLLIKKTRIIILKLEDLWKLIFWKYLQNILQ